MNPGVLDYVFGAVILVMVVRCLIKGFIAEIVAVAAIGGGIIGGILFSGAGGELLSGVLGDSFWNRVIAFLVIFLAVYLVLKIAEGLLYRLIEAVNLENLDRALGFFWGLGEGLVLSILLLLILETQPFVDTRRIIDESLFAQFIEEVLPAVQIPGTVPLGRLLGEMNKGV
ncbi:CvpA family protein [Marispirochaeta sp.]|uniref:CvpA family protein n=1 Tax=Marispirochaeta sp. TaxID=2038653 RepID=UPI0029C84AD7|nr:CvpA family protein [Marispirochaeta sp.]